MKLQIAFIGGGNMASAILGGLLRQGTRAEQVQVVDPSAEVAARLQSLGVTVLPQAGPELARAELVIWAVKPQVFAQAAHADRKSTRLNSSHIPLSRMPSSA